MHGPCMHHAWSMRFHAKKEHGHVHGPCMEYTWIMHGPCMEVHGAPTRVMSDYGNYGKCWFKPTESVLWGNFNGVDLT